MKQSVRIFPNPTKRLINIEYGANLVRKLIVEIYTIEGDFIFTQTFLNTTTAQVDLKRRSKGFYIIKVKVGKTICDSIIYLLR